MDEILKCNHSNVQMKATEYCFLLVLFVVLQKVVLLKSVG